jgi:GTP cyclohydrolase I
MEKIFNMTIEELSEKKKEMTNKKLDAAIWELLNLISSEWKVKAYPDAPERLRRLFLELMERWRKEVKKDASL